MGWFQTWQREVLSMVKVFVRYGLCLTYCKHLNIVFSSRWLLETVLATFLDTTTIQTRVFVINSPILDAVCYKLRVAANLWLKEGMQIVFIRNFTVDSAVLKDGLQEEQKFLLL